MAKPIMQEENLTVQGARRFLEKINYKTTDECWTREGKPFPSGYKRFWEQEGNYLAHRVAYYLFVGPIPDCLSVLHKCDNRECCNPFHLFLGTLGDNNTDRKLKGRSATGIRSGAWTHPERRPRGESHGCAKLTDLQVKEIRRLLSSGMSQRSVAQMMGISTAHMSRLARGESRPAKSEVHTP